LKKRSVWGQFALPIGGVAFLVGLALVFGSPATGPAQGQERVRFAYFPNLTHAPALVGVARGEFQRALPSGVVLDPKLFNAGPEAMEALLAGEVDVCFVGPSPAINTYLKSGGKALRLLAGAASGGSALVARADVPLTSVRDLDGKRVAVPQLGGTQDVSLRYFISREGLTPREKGGSVEVLPVKNPDILALMQRRQIDAAWVPEPWASRLIHDAKARLVVDERTLWPGGKYATTVLVARTAFLEKRPPWVERLLEAHLRNIAWLNAHPEEGQTVANAELKRLTGKPLATAVLKDAWTRLEFTSDPQRSSIDTFMKAAAESGYLPDGDASIAGLYDLAPLENARHVLALAR